MMSRIIHHFVDIPIFSPSSISSILLFLFVFAYLQCFVTIILVISIWSMLVPDVQNNKPEIQIHNTELKRKKVKDNVYRYISKYTL